MALEPNAASARTRARVIEIMQDQPGGLTPAAVYKIISGKDSPDPDNLEEKNEKQRVYYWLKALTKQRMFTNRGTLKGSTYFLAGNERPTVNDLPTKRKYTPRGTTPTPPAANHSTNGLSENSQLIAFIVDDISEKLDRLKRLVR